jgi:hypothetical protein
VDNKREHEMSSSSPTNAIPPLGNSRHFHTKRGEPSSNKNHHECSAKLVTKHSMEILGKEPTITTIIMVCEAPRYSLDVFRMTSHTHNTMLKVISKKNIKL